MLPAVRNRLRLLPAVSAVGVAIAVGGYMIGSPVGSQERSTVTLAGIIVGVTLVALLSVATGRMGVATAIGLLYFPAGMVGFALGAQLWIIGSLVLLSTTLGRPYAPYVLLAFVGVLLGLTVLTTSWYREVVVGLAVAVFAAAAYSAIASRREAEPT